MSLSQLSNLIKTIQMKAILKIVATLFAVFSTTLLSAQADTTKVMKENHPQKFVDKNGDGYNDNAPDDDGDGIPNGIDPDYKPGKRKQNKRTQFVDLDGDGINDNLQTKDDNTKNSNRDNLQKNGENLLQEEKGKNRQKGAGGKR